VTRHSLYFFARRLRPNSSVRAQMPLKSAMKRSSSLKSAVPSKAYLEEQEEQRSGDPTFSVLFCSSSEAKFVSAGADASQVCYEEI